MDSKDIKKAIEESVAKGLAEAAMEGLQIVIREGAALPLLPPKGVCITGAIDSPARWANDREGLYNPKDATIYIDRDARQIKLNADERNPHGGYSITGVIELSKEFTEIGINETKRYTPQQLGNLLKMRRSMFDSVIDHATLISILRNLKAKINKQLEDSNDNRGNTAKVFEQTVESNMPEAFYLTLQIVKGAAKTRIPVSIVLQVEGGEIMCYLESIEASEYIDQTVEAMIADQIAELQGKGTILEV